MTPEQSIKKHLHELEEKINAVNENTWNEAIRAAADQIPVFEFGEYEKQLKEDILKLLK
jgi:hypothetical protein